MDSSEGWEGFGAESASRASRSTFPGSGTPTCRAVRGSPPTPRTSRAAWRSWRSPPARSSATRWAARWRRPSPSWCPERVESLILMAPAGLRADRARRGRVAPRRAHRGRPAAAVRDDPPPGVRHGPTGRWSATGHSPTTRWSSASGRRARASSTPAARRRTRSSPPQVRPRVPSPSPWRSTGPSPRCGATRTASSRPRNALGVQTASPHATCVEWDGMGHHPQRERLGELVALVARFRPRRRLPAGGRARAARPARAGGDPPSPRRRSEPPAGGAVGLRRRDARTRCGRPRVDRPGRRAGARRVVGSDDPVAADLGRPAPSRQTAATASSVGPSVTRSATPSKTRSIPVRLTESVHAGLTARLGRALRVRCPVWK